MVYVFLADGFETVEALIPVDYLRRAGVDVKTVGVTGKTVKSAQGVNVEADIPLDGVRLDNSLECVVLPGGMPGTKNLEASAEVKNAVKYASENGKVVSAICAAPSVLGHMGLLDGKKAVCYPGFEKELYGADVQNAYSVVDGKVITAAGAGSATEFAFDLITALRGEGEAENVKRQVITCY